MKFFRIFLQSFGALSLILLGALAIYVVWAGTGSKNMTDKGDARFVLNWGGLSTDQDWSVIAGSASPRNITGDHTDYYCIQLTDTSIDQQNPTEWQDGPKRNELFSQALKEAIEWAKLAGADCFPSFEIANSSKMKILFWGMSTHGRSPAGAQVLLLQPATKHLFYVSFDT